MAGGGESSLNKKFSLKRKRGKAMRAPDVTALIKGGAGGAGAGGPVVAAPQRENDDDGAAYTRVMVSGLSQSMNAAALRRHFAELGEITDVSMPFKQGDETKNRGFGFVGFASPEAATAAVRRLHRSYLGATRVTVRPARLRRNNDDEKPAVVDAPPPPPKKKQKTEEEENEAPTRKDRFMELMGKRGAGEILEAENKVVVPKKKKKKEEEEETIEISAEAFDEEMDDMAYLASKKEELKKQDDKDVEDDDDDDDEASRTRLYVTNVPFDCGEGDLEAAFQAHGTVAEVHAPVDPLTKQPRGYAFVSFVLPGDAVKAREAMHGRALMGRTLFVVDAEQRRKKASTEEEDTKRPATFAAKREEERRKRATQRDVGWHAGHVRSDAVGDAIAAQLDVSKSELLDPTSSGETAVTMALAESALQTQTAAYFADQGYDLAAISTRSRTALLVKNLPHATLSAELLELFSTKSVAASRVHTAPSGVTAVVEFEAPTEARAAFKRLAYRRFKHVPLYLEWAPEKKQTAASNAPKGKKGEDEEEVMAKTTVFVKNLAFETDSEALKDFFSKHHKPRTVVLPPGSSEAKNRGFGFVEFSTTEEAKKAIAQLNGSKLHKHALALALTRPKTSDKKHEDELDDLASSAKSATRKTKLLVRNLAFATTAKDVRSLFAAFGELSSVRVPKRFDGRHRGFAFVIFDAARDAKRAFDALKSTHLYGRHLVIEYATADTPPTGK